MILFIFIYCIPLIINLFAYGNLLYLDELQVIPKSDIIVTYCILCFMPMINLLATIYLIVDYVQEIFGED